MHIVIVDDEKVLSTNIQKKLLQHHYSCTLFHSIKEYISSNIQNVDLYILDVSLGDGSGYEIIEYIRKDPLKKDIPILIISGHDEISTKIQGLDLGADDYMVKPFHPDELLARIRSCLRKYQNTSGHSLMTIGDVTFNIATRKVEICGKEIPLSKKEKQILEFLIKNKDTLVSKTDLIEKFWHNKMTLINDNTINVTICNLRKKLNNSIMLETQNGEGYILHSRIQ